jgi:hypothetical protein
MRHPVNNADNVKGNFTVFIRKKWKLLLIDFYEQHILSDSPL